jgi:hypothetical protein
MLGIIDRHDKVVYTMIVPESYNTDQLKYILFC